MEQFVTIERAIACPRASVAVAAETAAQVLTAAGYRRGLGFGPTSSYVRVYRPPWVVAVAVLGALPTLGLALLLLRYRSKDHCNVVIEDGPYGVVALVSGRVPASLSAALENATGEYLEQPQQQYGDAQAQQAPPPVLLAPSAVPEGSPSHTPQAILRPSAPVAGADYGPAPAAPGHPQYSGPAFDPYSGGQFDPAAQQQHAGQQYAGQQYGQPPGAPQPGPNWAHRPDDFPLDQPGPAASAPSPPPPPAPPVAVRPPSKLAPPMPPDAGHQPLPPPVALGKPSGGVPGGAGAGSGAGAGRGAAAKAGPPVMGGSPGSPGSGAPPASAPHADDDLFSSTSGRVPWVGGGRPGPLPAPPASVPPGSGGQGGQGGSQGAPGGQSGPGGAGGPGRASMPTVRSVTAVSDHTPVLRVDTGEVLELGPFCLLGREPVTRDGDPEARLIRFEDPKLSVSKTHMAYGVDGSGIWIMDRNSTNGTTVIDPDGRRTPCAPGARHYVMPGFQVQVGQRRIKVEAPGRG